MKKLKKKIISATLALTVVGASSTALASAYEIKPGDTFWKISQAYGISVNELLKANNATENTILYVGDKIEIPDREDYSYYEVKSGDTLWLISQRFGVSLNQLFNLNGLNESSIIYVGQKLKILGNQEAFTPAQPNFYIEYINHTVQKGDDFWKISLQYGVPVYELMKANNATANTILYIGQNIKIPVHKVPVMETPDPQYGEYLDWWNGVQYVIPIGSVFKVTDFYTGKSFMVKRTTGANHADVETLTSEDTKVLKEIWGGNFSWVRRPVIIEYNGRRIAGSAAAMPHAGNDAEAGGSYATSRSGGYGAGINLDYVKDNDMDGHFDIHFFNSTRHKDGAVDSEHQKNIKIAAGLIR